MKKNIANLIKVKTIITFTILMIFSILSLRGSISGNDVMIIVSSVISFYFGTQQNKKE